MPYVRRRIKRRDYISARAAAAASAPSAGAAAQRRAPYALSDILKRRSDLVLPAAGALAEINVHGYVYVFRTVADALSAIIVAHIFTALS